MMGTEVVLENDDFSLSFNHMIAWEGFSINQISFSYYECMLVVTSQSTSLPPQNTVKNNTEMKQVYTSSVYAMCEWNLQGITATLNIFNMVTIWYT
jgi:hypothetical protein